MTSTYRIRLAICCHAAILALAVWMPQARAQSPYPNHPIDIIVPYAPGGGHDFVARLMAVHLGSIFGQSVVVLNKAGADGMIGAQYVSQAKPDGYTLMMASPAETVIAPSLYKHMPYDPKRDLQPVTLVGVTPIALIANPSLPVDTLTELVAYAKQHPNKLSYGSPGTGSAQQLATDWIMRLTGIKMVHVPYKGAGPATTDVLSGQIPLGSVGMAPVIPNWKAGNLKVLAIMNNKRLPWLPNVPAASETPGAGAVDVVQWMGLFVPHGTPAALVKRINAAFAQVLHDPKVRDAMRAQGVDAVGDSVAEFSDYLSHERSKYAALVKESGIHLN